METFSPRLRDRQRSSISPIPRSLSMQRLMSFPHNALLAAALCFAAFLQGSTTQAQTLSVQNGAIAGSFSTPLDSSGIVLRGDLSLETSFTVTINSAAGSTVANVLIGPNSEYIAISQNGNSGYRLDSPVVLESPNGDRVLAFGAANQNGGGASGIASRGWLDNYSDWFNGTFGSGWSESVGGVIHSVLTTVISDETLAVTSDGALLTGTVIVSIPVAFGIVAGGEVVLGVGTLGGTAAGGGGVVVTGVGMSQNAIMRAFFTGQTLVNNPVNVAALYWYLQLARDTLARYQQMGYTGPGVATQTERIRQILEQLQRWGY